MSYETYYRSEAPLRRLFKEHRFKIYYLLFLLLLVVAAVAADVVGFPIVGGMLVSYVFLFTAVSFLFIFVPVVLISRFF